MLTYDPAVRVTAAEALKHPFFAEQPLAQDPAMMPSFPATNDRSRKKLKSELEAQHQAAEKAEKAASAPARE
ncbi:putative cyclin-dependent kinase 10 [Diplonema papillatum]|nr:putative cyclin-dependent kinase 10 [Diplonema papillatum]